MVNVALHVIVTLVLLTVLWRISGSFWPSALVAALHALHPLSVESVAWISHLRDPLSLLFWLGDVGLLCLRAEKRGSAISLGRAAVHFGADGQANVDHTAFCFAAAGLVAIKSSQVRRSS